MTQEEKYIEEIKALPQDDTFEEKFADLVNRIAAERIVNAKKANPKYVAPVDPQDALNCEGCQ